MTDFMPAILFPEVNDPAVAALKERYEALPNPGVNLHFDNLDLDEAARRLKDGQVDIVIAGVAHDTPTLLRSAIHHISKEVEPDKDKRKTITSFFVMEKAGEEPIFFADCAIHEYPDSDMLTKIAEQTCESVKHLGYEPTVAFLSLSTFGSAGHLTSVQKVKQAADQFKDLHPEIVSYGEIQADAAMNPAIFWKKAQKAGIEMIDGKIPNVYIFPDGVSGNITYKVLEQKAGYTAVGPLLDGTYKDIHDSSRGATTDALIREAIYATQLFNARRQQEGGAL